MTILLFSIILFGCSMASGLVGSLTGLGGGVVLIPPRIIFSIAGFIKEKDVLYTGITLFVLGVIIASLL